MFQAVKLSKAETAILDTVEAFEGTAVATLSEFHKRNQRVIRRLAAREYLRIDNGENVIVTELGRVVNLSLSQTD